MLALKIALVALVALGSIGAFLRVVEWNRQKVPRGRTDSPPPDPVADMLAWKETYNCRCVLDPDLIGRLWDRRLEERVRADRSAIDEVSLARFAYGAKVLQPTATFFLPNLAGPEPSIWGPPRLAIDHWKRSLWGFGKRWTRIRPQVWIEYYSKSRRPDPVEYEIAPDADDRGDV